MQTIIFVSANDIKFAGLQVIKRTLEHYADTGWDVHFVVARDLDTRMRGNYYYEPRYVLPDVTTHQVGLRPLGGIGASHRTRVRTILLLKSTLLPVICKGAVIYGMDIDAVLAIRLSRRLFNQNIVVSRFFGVARPQVALSRSRFRRFFSRDGIWSQLAISCKCDQMIMTNDGTQGRSIVQRHAPHQMDRFLFLTNGVDAPEPPSRVEHQPSSQGLNLLLVSRLVGWKRVHLGIRAAALLRDQGLAVAVRIVGEGMARSALESLTRELNLTSNVKFLGAVPNADVWSNFAWAHFLVSTYDWSNVGNPLLEALTSGLPVATVDNGGTRDWIRDGDNGILVADHPETIAHNIAGRIEYYCNHPRLWQNLCNASLLTARREIRSWDERLSLESKVIKALLG